MISMIYLQINGTVNMTESFIKKLLYQQLHGKDSALLKRKKSEIIMLPAGIIEKQPEYSNYKILLYETLLFETDPPRISIHGAFKGGKA